MKKMPMFIAFLVLFVVLANVSSSTVASAHANTATSAKANTIVPLPDTTNGFHLALIHESHATVSAESGVIDYVWGAQLPLPGHTPHKDFYQKFDRSGGDAGVNGSNVTTFPNYYNKDWFLKNHPDWLVYQCNKTALAYEYGDPNVPLDITNPAVQQFEMTTWIKPALDKGYDGISFDNVNIDNNASAGRCGVWTTNSTGQAQWKYLYGDAQSSNIHGQNYVNTVVSWASAMYSAIHAYQPAAVITMNYCPMNGGDMHNTLAYNEQLIPYTDQMLGEGGFTDGLNSPYTVDNYWQLENSFARDLAARGKAQTLIFGFDYATLTSDQKQWALANYLLVKGSHTYMTISSGAENGGLYGHFNIIPEYYTNIGHSISLMYQSQGVYMRDFSGGRAIVNPSSKLAYTITIPVGIYTDVYGQAVSGNVTLGIHSGLVLVNVAH